ncbi:MAG: hypothetical protein CMJ16_06415 [Peredibacter sp.]|nr:hypothetical protein [Peredibacter sp.]
MIGYLEGTTIFSDGKKLILNTNSGVGYEVNYAYFSSPGETTKVFVHHSISENDQSLWGFKTVEEKAMFELLKSVNKVGPSKAYPLVTQVGISNLVTAIVFEQKEVLTQAQGIGKKMAEQIILSLKDKIQKLDIGKISVSEKLKPQMASGDEKVVKDAIQALESLGYSEKIVAPIVGKNYSEDVGTSEELIKLVLREL